MFHMNDSGDDVSVISKDYVPHGLLNYGCFCHIQRLCSTWMTQVTMFLSYPKIMFYMDDPGDDVSVISKDYVPHG